MIFRSSTNKIDLCGTFFNKNAGLIFAQNLKNNVIFNVLAFEMRGYCIGFIPKAVK